MINSVTISFVLGEIFSLVMILFGIAMMSRVNFFRALIQKVDPESPALMAIAVLGLVIGLVLVGVHSHWEMKARVLITVLCWAVLIKSIFWIFASDKFALVVKQIFLGIGYYYFSAIITIFGAILLISAFFRYMQYGIPVGA